MDDIEKGRVSYVQELEVKMKHLQAEHDRFKRIADKWEPRLTVVIDPKTQKTTFGLAFGGKKMQATVGSDFLAQMDATGITTQLADTFYENLVSEHLKTIIRPEVERVQKGAISVEGAGKW
jgi:hypothetical protein